MTNTKSTLEEIVWKGSQMPLKFNFVNRQDICKEINELNNQWKSVESDAILKSTKYSDLLNNIHLLRKQTADLNDWMEKYRQLKADYKHHYLDKMMDGLMVYEKDLQVKEYYRYMLDMIVYQQNFSSSKLWIGC